MVKKKNAFSFFLDDYVRKEREKGRNLSKRVAVEECAPLWKNLSDVEKEVFIASALSFKNEKDCMRKQEFDLQIEEENIKKQGSELVYLSTHITNKKALKNHRFYVIHCNYYCRTEEGLYVPGELALSEFSLEDGIQKTFHTLINPGNLPLGYAYEGKRLSNEIHGLPTPPYEEGEKDFHKILNNFLEFMEPSKENEGEYAPLFTIDNNIEAISNVISKLISFEYDLDKPIFRVFPLFRMFYWLKNKCIEFSGSKDCGFPVLSNAISEIEKDVFRYVPNISCEFHSELEDKYHNCSLSIVQRLPYIICDHCCSYLGVELIPGKHVHIKSQDSKKQKNANQNMLNNKMTAVGRNAVKVSPFDELDEISCSASTYASSFYDDDHRSQPLSRTKKSLGRFGGIEYGSSDISSFRDAEKNKLFFNSSDSDTDGESTVVSSCSRGKYLKDVIKAVGLPQ